MRWILVAILTIAMTQAVSLGVVEGYVYDDEGPLANMSVSVEILGCSGYGCTGKTVTDSNGYYVLCNLNVPAHGGVLVTVGNTSVKGVANQYYVAEVDVTLK